MLLALATWWHTEAAGLMQAEMPEPAWTGLPADLAQPETREPGGHTQHRLLSCRCPPGAQRTPLRDVRYPQSRGCLPRFPAALGPQRLPPAFTQVGLKPRFTKEGRSQGTQPGRGSWDYIDPAQVTCFQGAESLPDAQRCWLREGSPCRGHQQGLAPGPLPRPLPEPGALSPAGPETLAWGTLAVPRAALTEDRASSLLLPWLCRPMKERADSL